MSSVLESSYLRRRLQEMDERYPEPNTLGQCDCTSYSYVGLSAILLSVGSYITVLALGHIDGLLFSSLGHMWLVGPIFICSGVMIAVKSILYLRRKSVSQMLFRQRVLLRGLQQIAQQSVQSQGSYMGGRNASTLTLPPAYEALIDVQGDSGGLTQELPPPSYQEAMFLVGGELLKVPQEDKKSHQTSSENPDRTSKDEEQRQGTQGTSLLP